MRALIIEITRGLTTPKKHALHAALSAPATGLCRFAASVGHRNEVWVDPRYEAKTRAMA